MPSSVKVGVRPMMSRIRAYSSAFSPWAAIRSSFICGSCMCFAPGASLMRSLEQAAPGGKRGERVLDFANAWFGFLEATFYICRLNRSGNSSVEHSVFDAVALVS